MTSSTRWRKLLIGLVILGGIVDVSVATWIAVAGGDVSNPDLQSLLIGWTVVLNLVIIVISALAIKKGLSRRRKQQRHFHSSLQTHRPSDFRRTYTTINGETVKSMGEKLLADYFYQNDIRYQYERTAWTTDNKLKHRRMISKPDFYLPDYDLYVEYWGMVDTEDESNRADYIKSMKWKMARYDENKIKFISIYPKDLDDLDRIVRAKMSESARTGRDRRDRFS